MKFFAVLVLVAALVGCAKDKVATEKKPEELPIAKTAAADTKKPAPKPAKPTTQVAAPVRKAPEAPAENVPIVTTTDDKIGRVAMVNPSARFAVITFPFGQVPHAGQQLNLYRKGVKVGVLRVTGPQREFNTVADVVSGNAESDDEVRPD